jgi:hypothetical protein
MTEDRIPKNPVEIYLTNAQLLRLVGLSADSLVGIQIGSDCADNTILYAHFVDYDQRSRHYEIYTDGSHKDVT